MTDPNKPQPIEPVADATGDARPNIAESAEEQCRNYKQAGSERCFCIYEQGHFGRCVYADDDFSASIEEKITCGVCHKSMTPQNSTLAPEYFLCDECAAKEEPWKSRALASGPKQFPLTRAADLDERYTIMELACGCIIRRPSDEKESPYLLPCKKHTTAPLSPSSAESPRCPEDVVPDSAAWWRQIAQRLAIQLHEIERKQKPEETELPKSNQPWQCETCGSGFAEYINGCPHCWEAGVRSSVWQVSDATPEQKISGEQSWTEEALLCKTKDQMVTLLRALSANLKSQSASGEYVAWLRYVHNNAGEANGIRLCDSDSPGAFRVYRHPAPSAPSPAPVSAERGEGASEFEDSAARRRAREFQRAYQIDMTRMQSIDALMVHWSASEIASVRASAFKGFAEIRAEIRKHVELDDEETLVAGVQRMGETLKLWSTWGMIELALRNPNVSSYMEEWEKRVETAEADAKAAHSLIESLRSALQLAFDALGKSHPVTAYWTEEWKTKHSEARAAVEAALNGEAPASGRPEVK